ncbi:hypothetical protein [Tsuneonella sp. SYSU-LHT278]|uniref:hypothetical protein n=1 Tax=Tsuneonella sediminis TaxID=3416089 RepID=UPI003F7B09C9
MFTQLNPPIPLHVLDKGDGLAFGVIDYGPEHNLFWITALDANGEIWCAPNPQVRMQSNWSMGRGKSPAVAASRGRLAAANASPGEICADCSDALASRA